MRQVIDDVRVAFLALRQSASTADELRVLPVSARRGVMLGLNGQGRPHLLIEVAEEPSVPPTDIATLEISHRVVPLSGTQTPVLDVTCLNPALTEVFDHFVAAVIERLPENLGERAAALSEVLELWRRFLIAAGAPPARDRMASVFGELCVLLDVVRERPEAVDAWVGPHGGRHDLRRGLVSVEVKTTRAHTAREVTIHGEDQLVEPEGGALFLHFVRLEEVPDGGRSVASLVDEILSARAPVRSLYDALAAAGIPPAALAETDAVRFDVRERLTIPVDERLPRIVPSSFAGGSRPLGVLDLSYRVDLDHVLELALDEVAYATTIRDLAGRDR